VPERVRPYEPGRAGARRNRLALGLAALALVPSLSGCIAAAVAIPVAAAAGMIRESVRVRAATPVPQRGDGEVDAALVSARSADGVTLTTLTELPRPSVAGTAADPWRLFMDYALRRAADKQKTDSALLAPDAATTLQPRRLACPQKPPAVLVDLDNGPAPFAAGSTGLPSPGLAEDLARLREAGIVVLWISQASANDVRKVADALRLSGLDPSGRDPLLLIRNADDRKQTLRQEANLDVCVIAIAGDRRGDFDELFDYLRNSDTVGGLEMMLGSGWFIAPTPFEPAATTP
jgi:hypothetical protein